MNNDIIKFLNIEDKDIVISKILIDNNTKEIHLEKVLKVEFCPAYSSRMHYTLEKQITLFYRMVIN